MPAHDAHKFYSIPFNSYLKKPRTCAAPSAERSKEFALCVYYSAGLTAHRSFTMRETGEINIHS